MRIHQLKTWPEYFQAVADGDKPFEIRKDDRNFQVGDMLMLCEFDPDKDDFTGRALLKRAGYVLNGGQFGLADGYVCIALIEPDIILIR